MFHEGTMLAGGTLPLIFAFLTLLLYLLFRPSQDEVNNAKGHEAFQDWTLTLILIFSSCAAALCLAQALLTENLLYALLATAIGGLLALAGQRPRKRFED